MATIAVVIICVKTGRVKNSTLETTLSANQAYGVALTTKSQGTHTADESAYDHPAVNQDDILNNDTRVMNEAYGVNDQDTTTGDGTGYSHPAAVTVNQLFQAGTTGDSIEAKRNEAYAANIEMEKNDAYKSATVVDNGTPSGTYYCYDYCYELLWKYYYMG